MRRELDPPTIGPHSIVETVETRAFSVTYRAERKELGRTVLLRTLRPTVPLSSPYAAELVREAAILGRLEHPGIVRLYDFVHTAEALYLVLEDARGPTLAALIQVGRVEADPAAALALALARALAHCHERGVVHRALRPRVVILGRGGALTLGDFSTAGAEKLSVPESSEPLDAGESATRLDYQSPEQILGETGGPPADVWSLGVILHELLGGDKPFAAGDRKVVAQRIRSAAPTPLPATVPRALAQIVERCLARLPEDRYADAGALAEALEAALAARTPQPVPALIARALASAKLGEAPSSPGVAAPRPRAPGRPDVMAALRSLGVVAALIVAGGVGIQTMREQEPVADQATPTDSTQAPAGPRDRGLVKVVARPWAEVYVDGELIDVTPIGRPILVTPGKHYLTFRHPKAPDEARTIKIVGGQTVLLDVSMRIDRGLGDAGLDAARDAAESP
jgi:serine/threonine-protein kinase